MMRPEYALLANARRTPASVTPTKIPLISEQDATGETAAAYQYFRDQTGRQDVPGIIQCFGSNPALLKQMVDFSGTLLFVDGHLLRRQKEMIASYVSALNDCEYCLDSHAFFLRVQGVAQQSVCAITENRIADADLSAAERGLLEYVRKVNMASHETSAEDVQHLRALGWSTEQIAEAVYIAAFYAMFNRVANAFGLASQGFMNLPLK